MSTIIESRSGASSGWRLAGACVVALGAWFGGLLVGAFAFEPTQAVLIVAPGRHAAMMTAEQVDVDLLDASGAIVTVSGRSAGFVRRLYASGAWFVLPVGTGGCRSRVSGRPTRTS